MKPNELRIGNLFKYSDNAIIKPEKIGVISSIIADDILFLAQSDNENLIEPIPLTEEWLLKFSYLPWPFAENHFYTKGHVIWNCNGQFICDKAGVALKYVHQLQNLYFALTGQELTLKS